MNNLIIRSFSCRNFITATTRLRSNNKYSFYDAVVSTKDVNPVRSDAYYISRQKAYRDAKEVMVFDPSAKKAPKFEEVFGGSDKLARKSSRRDVSYRNISKIIGGVKVPSRPIEPDNCCMSGCINCVWELFNGDLEEWRFETKKAADNLMAQGDKVKELWPLHFDPPPKYLPDRYIPLQLRKEKGKERVAYEMPVGLQVFANFEKKKKAAKERKVMLKNIESSSPDPASITSNTKSSSVSANL